MHTLVCEWLSSAVCFSHFPIFSRSDPAFSPDFLLLIFNIYYIYNIYARSCLQKKQPSLEESLKPKTMTLLSKYSCTHARGRTRACTYTHPRTDPHTRTHTNTHTHTHTNIHTRIHTYLHKHTRACVHTQEGNRRH